MAFGNYYGGVTNDKNILDKLAEMTKELREVKGIHAQTQRRFR